MIKFREGTVFTVMHELVGEEVVPLKEPLIIGVDPAGGPDSMVYHFKGVVIAPDDPRLPELMRHWFANKGPITPADFERLCRGQAWNLDGTSPEKPAEKP